MSFEHEQTLPVGVLLSGTGRTLANLLEEIQSGDLPLRIVAVGSDRESARGLEIARAAQIPVRVFKKSQFAGKEERDREIFHWQHEHGARLLCLAGYLSLLDLSFRAGLPVLNIHPALLPRFGGAGYYGDRVHSAVLAAGEKESGATVHLVDEHFDSGQILARIKVPVLASDDLASLRARVFQAECRLYPRVLAWIAAGKLRLTPQGAFSESGSWAPVTLDESGAEI